MWQLLVAGAVGAMFYVRKFFAALRGKSGDGLHRKGVPVKDPGPK